MMHFKTVPSFDVLMIDTSEDTVGPLTLFARPLVGDRIQVKNGDRYIVTEVIFTPEDPDQDFILSVE